MQGPDGRYFVSVKTSPPLKFPSRSASPVSLNTGNNRNQSESGIEETAFFDYDPQGRTKFYHGDDLQSKPSFQHWCWAMYRRNVSKMTHNLYIGLIVILKSSTSVILVYCSVWQAMFAIEFYRSILIPGVITVSWQKCVCFLVCTVWFQIKRTSFDC